MALAETVMILLMLAGTQLVPEPARSLYATVAWRSMPAAFLWLRAVDVSGPVAIVPQVAPPPPPPPVKPATP